MKTLLAALAALSTLAAPALAIQPRGYRARIAVANRSGHTVIARVEGRDVLDGELRVVFETALSDRATIRLSGLQENLDCLVLVDDDVDGVKDYQVPFAVVRSGRVTLLPLEE